MDPTATWELMLACLHTGDRDGAHEAATNLYEWLGKGGFAPTIGTMRRVDFEQIARAVIQACGVASKETALDVDMTQYIVDLVERNPGQMTVDEYGEIADRIVRADGCKLLVFGCGKDSELWAWANHKGETVFLEHSPKWADSANRTILASDRPHGDFRMVAVEYRTKLERWQQEITGDLFLFGLLDFPGEAWDIVVVDSPQGAGAGAPGRLQSIYEAGRLVKPDGWIYVHDMKRPLERAATAHLLRGKGFKRVRVTENLSGFRRDDAEL